MRDTAGAETAPSGPRGRDGGRYFWCLRHHRVESADEICAGRYLLGPYGSPAAASAALDLVRQRNDEWEAEDARWAGEAR